MTATPERITRGRIEVRMSLHRTSFILVAAIVTVLTTTTPFAADRTEILWDRYGIPHIFAADTPSLFRAHGWAQMRNQANLLLRLYGESRGRAAEYWGPGYLELDRWVHINGVPERARAWYDAQDPVFRSYLDEFARGINEFSTTQPDAIAPDLRVVLPITGLDVVQHSLRAVHYGYMASRQRMQTEVNAMLRKSTVAALETGFGDERAGSNTWSVGPSRSASGNALLLINPHLAWGDTFYRYMEVHQVAPGIDLFGTPQIGFPVAVVGFNRRAGWGRTVNTIDTVDFYRLTVKGDEYVFDGKLRSFERETKTIRIKQADGSFTEERLQVRRSVHGPVVYDEDGITIAMRVAGLDRPRMLEQWFRMGQAQTLAQFQDALRMGAVPMWNANFADADGHIMLVFNGLVPRRKANDYTYWSGVVPGDTSDTMWTDYLSFEELPKSIDPPSGFHQNANEPPWLSTLPPLDRTKYPEYVAPRGDVLPQMRTLRSLRLISEDSKITYSQFIAKKHSTRMELADKVLPDLLKAANNATEAARVLSAWDRNADVDSRGGVLFQMFVEKYFASQADMAVKLRVRYDPARPLDSAYGLADPPSALKALDEAAEECRRRYGSLDVKWGDVYRFSSGKADLPGNGGAGGSGLFRTITYSRRVGDKFYAASGETIVCAIEFSRTQTAQCLLGYGNASQPGSPHLEDQLPMMVEKRLLPVWRERKDIEANLEQREAF